MPTSWRHRVWPWFFVAHAALVVLLLAALYWMILTADGPPILGGALVYLPLLGLGVPWSIPVIVGDPADLDGLPMAVRELVTFGPAVLNVLLHGGVLALAGWARRRREESSLVGARQR